MAVVTFPALPKTVKTYKSERAARMAVGKADRAYGHALSNRGADDMQGPRPMGCDLGERCFNYIECAWINIERTIAAAAEQGFTVRSANAAHAVDPRIR